jgi:phthiodiolone/phenolphthiodiolone dimycocerosates ketoreductase
MPHPGLELSAMGAVRPPAAAAVAAARRREEQGFDAVWWADHLLHWFPRSIWTADLVPQARSQPSPHVWFDPFAVIAAAAGATDTLRLGVGVTDLVRRHPVSVAQTALTLAHLTGGRFLLGIGSGEELNLAPIGVDHARPLARLAEGLALIRALFDSPDPIDHDGEFFTVRDVELGLRPEGAPPAIWLAAHRPRGLDLVGRAADGWLPLVTDAEAYAEMLAGVRAAERAAGRPEGAVTAGLYARIVLADDAPTAARLIDESFLMRFIALTRPAEAFAARGADHPLGDGAFGLTSFLPTRYSRDEALALAARVPDEVVRDTVIFGTPDDVATAIGDFVAKGARHVQLTNMTPLASPDHAAASDALLGDLVATLRHGGRP